MDDKQQYIDTLKSLNMRPNKIKVENRETNEELLMEQGDHSESPDPNSQYQEILNEIFVQSGEIAAMQKGQARDMQILRLGIIAELDASNLYEKLALLASDKRVKEMMLDISQEEKVHVGEFETLLEEVDPEYEEAEEEGEEEAEELMGKKD